MIEFQDINEWLAGVRPQDYYLHSVDPRGGFLVVEYRRRVLWRNTNHTRWFDTCDIYLNNDGRPVGKTFDHTPEIPLPPTIMSVPVSPEKKILFGVKLALRGLRELIQCVVSRAR